MAILAWSASFSSPATTFASGRPAARTASAGLAFWVAVGAAAVLVDVAVAVASSAVSDGRRDGLLDHVEQARGQVVVDDRVHPVASTSRRPAPKWRRKLNAAMIVRLQSIWLARPP